MTSWVSHKFDYLMDDEKFPFHYVYFWIWVGMGVCDLFLARCGWVCPFFWLGVDGCGWVWPFFAACRWVWPFFGRCRYVQPFLGWMWVGVTILAGCAWVWVSARFITLQFKKLNIWGCKLSVIKPTEKRGKKSFYRSKQHLKNGEFLYSRIQLFL